VIVRVRGLARARPGAPTLVLYGHHDVCRRAAGRWASPPFEPKERGGALRPRDGRRQGASSCTWRRWRPTSAAGLAACNVKFLIEGEEEIGSENLATFLGRYAKRMAADAVVLSDTANFDTASRPDLPAARLCQVDVEVRCLERPVHSGQKGGIVPTPCRSSAV